MAASLTGWSNVRNVQSISQQHSHYRALDIPFAQWPVLEHLWYRNYDASIVATMVVLKGALL